MFRQGEKYVQKFVMDLLSNLQMQIQERETTKKMPHFLTNVTWQLALQNIIAVIPQSGKPFQSMFQEELLTQVPKLQKDTLMPKDLSGQKVRVNSPQRLSPSSRQSARKSINISKMNSIKLADKLKSISMIEKQGSGRELGKKQQLFTEIDFKCNGQIEDGELQKLREKTEFRMQYLEEQAKLKQQRKKYYQEQFKKFNQLSSDPTVNVTFDYDGDPLRRTLMDEEMRLHKLKAGFSYSKRKLKDGFTKLNAPQFSKIEVTKKQKERGESFRALRPLDIPTFYMKNMESYEVNKMKMEDFKKKYGKGYSRLGNQTVQTTQHQKTIQDLQIERRPAKEHNQQVVQSLLKIEGNRTARKLALPRLHGNYKVLDRYEDNE